MKPKVHPFYHFRKEFQPRPKLDVPRGFNWAMATIVILALAVWGAVYVFATHAAHGGH